MKSCKRWFVEDTRSSICNHWIAYHKMPTNRFSLKFFFFPCLFHIVLFSYEFPPIKYFFYKQRNAAETCIPDLSPKMILEYFIPHCIHWERRPCVRFWSDVDLISPSYDIKSPNMEYNFPQHGISLLLICTSSVLGICTFNIGDVGMLSDIMWCRTLGCSITWTATRS